MRVLDYRCPRCGRDCYKTVTEQVLALEKMIGFYPIICADATQMTVECGTLLTLNIASGSVRLMTRNEKKKLREGPCGAEFSKRLRERECEIATCPND